MKHLKTTVAAVAICAVGICAREISAQPSHVTFPSNWDRVVAATTVTEFRAGGNLLDVWSALDSQLAVRSVLVIDDSFAPTMYEQIAVTSGSVQPVFAKIAERFGYCVRADGLTGVTWLLPASRQYDSLLADEVTFRPSSGLPMLDAVLVPLESSHTIALPLSVYKGAQVHAFNFPVEVAPGTRTLRDLVNSICESSLRCGFIIKLSDGAPPEVTPWSLYADGNVSPRLGERVLTRVELGGEFRSNADLYPHLASRDARIRHFAYEYYEMRGWSLSMERLVREATTPEYQVAAAIGMAKSLKKTTRGSDAPDYVWRILADAASSTTLLKSNPGLYTEVALELLRVNRSVRGLEQLAKHPGASRVVEESTPSLRGAIYGLARAPDEVFAVKESATKRDDFTSTIELLRRSHEVEQAGILGVIERESETINSHVSRSEVPR